MDVRFWIIAREVAAGKETGSSEQELVQLLRRGVACGALACPISESTFIEVMKQANTPTRRVATASLIDELSLGISLITNRARVGTEIAHFFYSCTGRQNLYTMQELVWTKLSYALGYVHPALPDIDHATALPLQKAFFDHMWGISLSEMVATIGNAEQPNREALKHAAAKINAGNKAHRDTLKSFQQAYRDEIVGAVDISSDIAADVMCGMAERAGVVPAERGSAAWRESARMCRNLLIAAFDKPDTKLVLRTLHTEACLHAGFRWNKNTKFEENHFYDFDHAAAAVSYCDAFFTEGFLSYLTNAGHIGLGKLYSCRITANIGDAVQILKELTRCRP